MSKSFVPSRNLLSTFSRYLQNDKSQFSSAQCLRFSNIAPRALPKPASQCLRSTSRPFSTSPARPYKTVQEQRSRYRSGVSLPSLPLPSIPFPSNLSSPPQITPYEPAPSFPSSVLSHLPSILNCKLTRNSLALLLPRGPSLRHCRRGLNLLLPLRKGTHGT